MDYVHDAIFLTVHYFTELTLFSLVIPKTGYYFNNSCLLFEQNNGQLLLNNVQMNILIESLFLLCIPTNRKLTVQPFVQGICIDYVRFPTIGRCGTALTVHRLHILCSLHKNSPRMHSSRMRTGHSLTVCRALLPGGVCLSACWDTPLGADTPPGSRNPPGADTLPGRDIPQE